MDSFYFRPKDAVDLLADLWWDRDLFDFFPSPGVHGLTSFIRLGCIGNKVWNHPYYAIRANFCHKKTH